MNSSNAHKLDKLENVQILEHIQNYFKELNRNNRDFEDYHENGKSTTQTVYEPDIRLFLRITRGKEKGSELEYLSMDEIQFTYDDFEDFKNVLFDEKNDEGKNTYTNKTINRKIAAIKSFTKYLAKKKLIKDVSFLELVNKEKERENHYGVLETNEVETMAELASQEREKGKIKRLLILLAFETCIRKAALLNLRWSNFLEREDGVLIQGVDKGNKHFRQLIDKDFYRQLLSIKTDSEYVFDISSDAIDKMMNRLRDKMNLPKERNIVFHSIRKAGVTFRYKLTGDILEAKRAANHSSVTTTEIYLKTEDYGAIGAVSLSGKIDGELYKKVDQEVLLEAISMCKKDVQLIINMKIKELMNKNS